MNEVKDVAWHSRGGQRAKSLTTPHSGRPEISPPPQAKTFTRPRSLACMLLSRPKTIRLQAVGPPPLNA